MEPPAQRARRRRLGVLLVALVAALFVVELVALALGAIALALACAGVFTVLWFVLRGVVRRREGR